MNDDIIYLDTFHHIKFLEFCDMFGGDLDEYRLAVAYLLALDKECCKHYKDIFDFSEGVIKPEGLSKGWQTGTSTKTTRLMMNLWNGYQYEGEPLEEEKPSSYYTPEHLFACSYAPYYWQAIKLRYPDYCIEKEQDGERISPDTDGIKEYLKDASDGLIEQSKLVAYGDCDWETGDFYELDPDDMYKAGYIRGCLQIIDDVKFYV